MDFASLQDENKVLLKKKDENKVNKLFVSK